MSQITLKEYEINILKEFHKLFDYNKDTKINILAHAHLGVNKSYIHLTLKVTNSIFFINDIFKTVNYPLIKEGLLYVIPKNNGLKFNLCANRKVINEIKVK